MIATDLDGAFLCLQGAARRMIAGGRGGRIDVPIDRMAETLAAPEPEAQLSPRETNRVLSAINGRQRDVVRAIAVEGLTATETAARLGVSEGAVRVALHRGLAAIAAAFRTEE